MKIRQLRLPRRNGDDPDDADHVNGVLYFTAGQRRTVVTANALNGETLWTWRPDEGARFEPSPRKIHRAVAYWRPVSS